LVLQGPGASFFPGALAVVFGHGLKASADADALQVKEQRRAEIPSKNREASIEDNLARFKVMLSGSDEGKKWSLRAKIDYKHKNGSMRDPVVYRYVEGSHHITG
jgi:glutamyl-tRNA synthetase